MDTEAGRSKLLLALRVAVTVVLSSTRVLLSSWAWAAAQSRSSSGQAVAGVGRKEVPQSEEEGVAAMGVDSLLLSWVRGAYRVIPGTTYAAWRLAVRSLDDYRAPRAPAFTWQTPLGLREGC